MSNGILSDLRIPDVTNVFRDNSGSLIAWRRGSSLGFMGFPADATPMIEWIPDDVSRIDFIDQACTVMNVELDDDDRESIQTAGQLLDLLVRRGNA